MSNYIAMSNSSVRRSKKIEKILVRGANWLGDTVMTLPALNLLRQSFPDARIEIISPPGTSELLDSTPYVDEVLVYKRKERGTAEFLAMQRRLRKAKFDIAILFPNAFEAALIAFLASIPHRIGFATQYRTPLLTNSIPPRASGDLRHQVFDYIDLVNVALKHFADQGLSPQVSFAPPMPVLKVAAAHRKTAIEFIERHQIFRSAGPIVAINPGATNSRAKCWGETRYAGLADALSERFGAQILLIGSQSERELASRIESQVVKAPLANFAGLTDIRTLIGILDASDVLIGNDTGPAHVSAALGRPTVTIFGPTNEFETAPLGPRTSIVRAEGIECERCMFRECPIDHRCMERLSVDAVLATARRFLN
jgi:lipopolysaccharide heptosyltransferase II